MPRLFRPHIPLEIRCRVAMRQLGEMWPDEMLSGWPRARGKLLVVLTHHLAELLGGTPSDLRLDHDPALAIRQKVYRRGEHVDYDPPANSIEHMVYRTVHAHHIKTNVRGDGAQHPDRVLIKRERKRVRALAGRAGAQKRAMDRATRRKRNRAKLPKRQMRQRPPRKRRRQLPLPPRRLKS